MEYKVRAIYAVSSTGQDLVVWCSSPQSLISEISQRDDISSDGYVDEEKTTDPMMQFMRRKIIKKIGIYLDNELIRVCNSKDEANELLKKFQAFEKKLSDMPLEEEIFLVDDDLYKFSNAESYESEDDY